MKKFLLLSLLTLIFACSEKQAVEVPGSVLTKEKMAEVLVDIHLLEASINLNAKPLTDVTSQPEVNADVLKKNAVTKAQYDESLEYYKQHPKMLAEVYQLVLNSLSKMQAEVMNKPEPR